MKVRGLFAVVAAAGLTMACQATEEESADGGLGAGGEGGGGNTAACEQICAKVAAVACPGDDPASCAADCNGLGAQFPAACQGQVANYLACAAGPQGTFTCDADGDASLGASCQAELGQAVACASSGAGGDTGSGGSVGNGGDPGTGGSVGNGGVPGTGGNVGNGGDPGSGGGVPPAGDCASAVERLVACATSGGNCQAIGDAAAFEQGLSGACASNEAAFVGLVNSAGSCGELIDTLSTTSPEFCAACHGEGSDACGGGPGPDPSPEAEAACQAYGDNIANCVVESCQPVGPYEQGLSGQFFLGCLDAVANGEAELGQIQAVGGASCAQLEQGLADLIQGQGPLAGLCAGMYVRDAAACDGWATEITTCLPADLGGAPELYRNPQFWALTCVIADDEQAGSIFMCVDAAADCNATLMCISG